MKIVYIFNILSAFSAIFAAIFWYVSAKIKVPKDFPRSSDGKGYSINIRPLSRSLQKQSKFSSYAALCASIAAICQAISILLNANSQ